MIRSNDSKAFMPEADKIIKAKGLNENTVSDTVHSNAFLSIPGKLNTYSGLQINTASAALISLRNVMTLTGISSGLSPALK